MHLSGLCNQTTLRFVRIWALTILILKLACGLQVPRLSACQLRLPDFRPVDARRVRSLSTNHVRLAFLPYRLSPFSFWVCEKSDGLRVLVMIVCLPSGQQEVYLVSKQQWSHLLCWRLMSSAQIDRKEHFYLQQGIYFPHQDGLDSLHSNVVLDAELVIDTDPKTGSVGYVPVTFHLRSRLTEMCLLLSAYTLSAHI